MLIDWNNALENIVINKYDHIFVYGAGRAGLLTFLFLQEHGIEIDGFIETHPTKNGIVTISKPIIGVDDFKCNGKAIVLLAILNSTEDIARGITTSEELTVSCIERKFFDEKISLYSIKIDDIQRNEQIVSYRGRAIEELVYSQKFINEIYNSDYDMRVERLLSGLDINSKAILLKSLERIRLLADDKLMDDCFEDFERMELIKSWEYCSKSHMVSEDMWELDGKYLPVNDFRGEIFYDHLGLSSIRGLDNIKNKDFIDIGGFIGDSGLIISEYSDGEVYVFEPIPSYISFIEKTAQMNKKSIKAINMAASDENGVSSFSIGEQVFNSTLQEVSGRNYVDEATVDVIKIDDFVKQRGLDIGLIKIHAEGAEQKVLRGAFNIIKEQEPVIIVEINHTSSDLLDIKPLIESINSRYKFTIYKPANGFVCMGMKLIAEVY